jgi:hypothetical protein
MNIAEPRPTPVVFQDVKTISVCRHKIFFPVRVNDPDDLPQSES